MKPTLFALVILLSACGMRTQMGSADGGAPSVDGRASDTRTPDRFDATADRVYPVDTMRTPDLAPPIDTRRPVDLAPPIDTRPPVDLAPPIDTRPPIDMRPNRCVDNVGCVCGDGSPGAVLCNPDGVGTCVCSEWALLQRARAAIVGDWTGTVSNPWENSHQVKISFTADGHYSDACDGNCTAFYYGDDGSSPYKTYKLVDVNTAGEVLGDIVIVFSGTTTTVDDIKHMVFSPDLQTLHFEVWHLGTYGPVTFDLKRR